MREISIPLDRYDELLDIETRVNVAIETAMRTNTADVKNILWILGTETSMRIADEMDKKEKERMRDYFNETAKKTD